MTMVLSMSTEADRSVSDTEGLSGLWECCAQPPNSISDPRQLKAHKSGWLSSTVPGTVAATLAANDQWSFEEPTAIDTSDWWFRTSFHLSPKTGHHPAHLHFDGLAGLAEVWLNGESILTTDNMFRSYCVDVSPYVRLENELIICFRSITEDLKRKRPRPRWKTNLVNNQQLRWHRTSLQGRIPGWSPPAPAIGPWRDIQLETGPFTPRDTQLKTRIQGAAGIVSFSGRLLCTRPIQRASLKVGAHVEALQLKHEVDGYSLRGEVHVAHARHWWPHTHGQPALYDGELLLESDDEPHHMTLSPIGFRQLEVNRDDGFQVKVNNQAVYCRGACWTVSDFLTLTGTEEQLRHDLTLARDAGVNMLRVGGTMVYESDTFYRLCDELGIMVWQDFMFANMDYPVDDEVFLHNVVAEVSEQLDRLASHPCVAVYCGNSEVEQQAAMLGMPREAWSNSWFGEQLPALCHELHPGTAYVPSTPTGGVLPFQANTGLTHYYGVGAYLRPTTDVRRSDVKFTPECLGFANIPESSTVEEITQGGHAVTHDPRWKRRVPRDTGAGWDFEDVRDHYLRELFHVDPVQLRSSDMPRYLQLSRLAPGEMMSQVFSEWRSTHGNNQGGLVWFYKDLWPACGWGIVDSHGTPKAAYYYLKRAWSNRQLVLTDEGLNGLQLHLINETTEACNGTVEVTLLKDSSITVARQELAFRLNGGSRRSFSADEILGGFYDVSYAYRFGPRQHDTVIATWFDQDRNIIGEAYHFLNRIAPSLDRGITVDASAESLGHQEYRVILKTDRLLQGVSVSAKGYLPDDNYFHLAPNRTKVLTFKPRSTQPPVFKASIDALNLDGLTVRSKSS